MVQGSDMIDKVGSSSRFLPPDSRDNGPPSYNAVTSPSSDSTDLLPASYMTPMPTLSAEQAYLFFGPLSAEDLSSPISHDIHQIDTHQIRQRVETEYYSAEISSDRIASAYTHDWRLSDPAVLYDYLRASSLQIPKVRLCCSSFHHEVSDIDLVIMVNGIDWSRKKGETYKVIDFDFFIDMTDINPPSGLHLSVLPPHIPAFRGKSSAAYGASHAPAPNTKGYTQLPAKDTLTTSGQPLTWLEHHTLKLWDNRRWRHGFPVWSKITDVPPGEGISSGNIDHELRLEDEGGPTLLRWCEDYCADKGWMKRFILRRDVWGWDFNGLVKSTEDIITAAGYDLSRVTVKVDWDEPEVVIRPYSRWNRANSNIFVHILLWLTLIFPFVWLLGYLGIIPGGKYDIARATYNLKPFTPLPSTYPGETVQEAQNRLPTAMKRDPRIPSDPVLRLGPKGVHYLAGRRECEWFAERKEQIRVAVQTRHQGEVYGRAEPILRDPSMDHYEERWSTA